MVEASRVLVTDAPVLLFSSEGSDTRSGASAVLIPITASAVVFLGGDAQVTVDDGVAWAPALGPLSLPLAAGEEVWGVCAATDPDQEVHVLGLGK